MNPQRKGRNTKRGPRPKAETMLKNERGKTKTKTKTSPQIQIP
jgi:hypothetical protein